MTHQILQTLWILVRIAFYLIVLAYCVRTYAFLIRDAWKRIKRVRRNQCPECGRPLPEDGESAA